MFCGRSTKRACRELWRSRSRTIMVALSVAIGVLGIGLIVTTYDVLVTDLYRRYAEIDPAEVEIVVRGGVDHADLKGLSTVSGVDSGARSRFLCWSLPRFGR